MKKFMFLHVGFEMPSDAVMAAWMTWFESLADHLLHQAGFAAGKEISATGTRDLLWDRESLTGYNIVQFENLEAALGMAASCPFISSIRVYELRS